MIYILVLIMSAHSIDHVEFANKDACNVAKYAVDKAYDGRSLTTLCVAKG